ncbi:MAG: TetR/AcrR family transcriptional regulator [Oscillospiraceae bacterium]|nr:TetR/AcrR family transcriptional regulator [Oscillospiraceae bacterium]
MDRRQRKTRTAIFHAFTELLSKKDFHKITVEEIIMGADVGRSTFYAHFETKDDLLKAFCSDLFCHVFDTEHNEGHDHQHIFHCSGSQPVFLHLFEHFAANDNNLLSLLSSRNNELFLRYFRENLESLIASHLDLFASKKSDTIPDDFWRRHIVSTFVETLKWWICNGRRESPEVITAYFFAVL